MPPDEAVPKRSFVARFGSYVGLAIGITGVAFVTRLVVRDWDEITDAVSEGRVGLLIAALVLGLSGMGSIGFAWVWLVRRSGAEVATARGLAWYFVGQLGKYVPGGIWPVVGRAELAVRGGVERRIGYTTTATSLFFTYLAAGVIAAALLPAALGLNRPLGVAAGAVIAGAACLVLHPRVTGRVLELGERVVRRPLPLTAPSWRFTLSTLARHVPAWAAIIAATWFVSRALSVPLDPLLLAAATPLAWLVGFLIIGLPSGLGVRESVFVAVVALESSSAAALSVALLARLIFLGVDILGALGASLMASALRSGRPAAVIEGDGAAMSTEGPRPAASLEAPDASR